MKLNLDFQTKENTIQEFKKILLKEDRIDVLNIKTLEETKEYITLEFLTEDKVEIFKVTNYSDKIKDQKSVMAKSGLLKLYNKSYPWGALVGVRPTKLVRRYKALGYTYEEIDKILDEMYFVFPEKRKLLLDVVKKEEEYLNKDGINVYVGIPYCPSRCTYCSFASYEIKSKLGSYYNEFVETLIEEIKLTGELLKGKKINIESLYFGGGTPSILLPQDIKRVIETLYKYIDFSNLKEFTFEAGREDTITEEKLLVLKELGVDRLSLNPQTFNEKILENLNRKFDRENFDKIFNKIKELGFTLNMDFIIGLPGETAKDILNTLEEVKKYSTDNLTIHFLAIKNGSNLIKNKYEITSMENLQIEEKIKEVVKDKNMKPYYLYRQKNSLAWGENVGYSVEGKESRFNIEMIEENQSTIAFGGGGISKKVKYSSENHVMIERYINPKDPYMYIIEMKERTKQKRKLIESL